LSNNSFILIVNKKKLKYCAYKKCLVSFLFITKLCLKYANNVATPIIYINNEEELKTVYIYKYETYVSNFITNS